VSGEQNVLSFRLGRVLRREAEELINLTVECVVRTLELVGHGCWRVQVSQGQIWLKLTRRRHLLRGGDDAPSCVDVSWREREGVPGQELVETQV